MGYVSKQIWVSERRTRGTLVLQAFDGGRTVSFGTVLVYRGSVGTVLFPNNQHFQMLSHSIACSQQ